MPPRQITSYFAKLPASVSPTAAARQAPASTSTSPRSPTAATATASALTRPVPVSPSQDSTEPPAKRAKLGTSTATSTAPALTLDTTAAPSNASGSIASAVISKAAAASAASSSTSRATTREELRERLSKDTRKAELLKTEVEGMGEDWLMALQDELVKPYFLTLKEFITSQQATKKVFPPAHDIYSWSRLCPLKDVRVVIIGQDPYHDDGQAHGLAFSVRRGVRVPPSLRNIYKEMNTEVPAFKIPKHGDLTAWATHGVLLLNTSLTVRAHEAGSHSNKGWETFTAAVLKVVTSRLGPEGASASVKAGPLDAMFGGAIKAKSNAESGKVEKGELGMDEKTDAEVAEGQGAQAAAATTEPDAIGKDQPPAKAGTGTGHVSGANGVCFMAWGAHAQKMCAGVDTKKHLVLKSVHPSPLAASRGFFGNGHFVKANEWLEERYGAGGGIDWAALGEQ